MIRNLIARLEQAKLDLSDEDIAEVIWLALKMRTSEPADERPGEASESDSPLLPIRDGGETIDGDGAMAGKETATDLTTGLPPLSAFPADALDLPSQEDIPSAPKGLPFQAPAAAALQNALELGRSLRPLMRRVPSQTRFDLDEEATVTNIVEQDIWQPILTPAPERWLDLELVVESSPLSLIWQKTIEDFRHKVLERQGAFRNVRAWTLQDTGQGPELVSRNPGDAVSRPGRPKELMHPSGRRLVMIVSDCRSALWRLEPLPEPLESLQNLPEPSQLAQHQPSIYPWLTYWTTHAPTVLVQLLPEWLWERSAIGLGFDAQLRALLPGVANTRLLVEGLSRRSRERVDVENALKLPIVTLDADTLLQCAEVIAGTGNVKTPGVLFNLDLLQTLTAEESDPIETTNLAVEETEAELLVDTFLATASPNAQQLAGMMAAAPVSLPVVHLLQNKLLQHSTPVHVAEVYMSGLLGQQSTGLNSGQPIYEFKTHVRKLLNRAMPVYTTEMVIDVLSKAIAEKLGIAIDSFAAFLSPQPEWLEADRTIARFAEILPEVLRNLGGDYAALVDQVEITRQITSRIEQSIEQLEDEQEPEFPSLSILEFTTAQLLEPDHPPPFPPLQMQEVEVVTIILEPELLEPEPAGLQLFEFEVATLAKQPSFWGDFFRRSEPQTEWVIQRQRRQAYQWVEALGNHLQLEMVAIPAGSFLMGAPEDEPERLEREAPQHQVTVPTFFMGRYPITQAQWLWVATLPQVNRSLDPDPSHFKGANRPVEWVSWRDAVEFCVRLSAATGRPYRLPTEAEWEYACRANPVASVNTFKFGEAIGNGTVTPFHFGETITPKLANYDGNDTYNGGPKGVYRQETTPVDQFGIANGFGLCDMHGNVWEWCQDHWHGSYQDAPTNGSAWLSQDENASRVRRGGSWIDFPRYCRSASRDYYSPDSRYDHFGFRVVCSAP